MTEDDKKESNNEVTVERDDNMLKVTMGFSSLVASPLQRNQFIVVHTAGHFKNEKSGGIEQRTQAIHSALKSPSKSVEQSGLPDLASSVYSH